MLQSSLPWFTHSVLLLRHLSRHGPKVIHVNCVYRAWHILNMCAAYREALRTRPLGQGGDTLILRPLPSPPGELCTRSVSPYQKQWGNPDPGLTLRPARRQDFMTFHREGQFSGGDTGIVVLQADTKQGEVSLQLLFMVNLRAGIPC